MKVEQRAPSRPAFNFLTSVGEGRNPLDDQGIFIPIIVRNQTHDLKFELRIKSLRPEIASSHLCPYLLKMGSIHRPSDESGPNASSSMVGVNRNRDNMPVLRKDDITQDFPSHAIGIAADQEGIGMEHVEAQEGRPVVRRLGKGLAFDLENRI